MKCKYKNTIRDLKKLEVIFVFSIVDENHELFSNKNKKVVKKFKIETPKNAFMDEFVCLRCKMYAFKCGDDSESKNKLKGISRSQSKNINFEDYKNCSNGKQNTNEFEIYILGSINHEMYLQEIK